MITAVSKIGTYHKEMGEENQDAICYGQNRRFSVIALADGVSSCKEAKCGAEIASRAITDLFIKKGEYFLVFEKEMTAKLVLSHILHQLKEQAEKDGCDTNAYSSTVAGVLIDKKNGKMLCLNLGDGLILVTGKGRCRIATMPADSEGGCCVTTTEYAGEMTEVRLLETEAVESVLICSDGAWRAMFEKNKLHPEAGKLLLQKEYEKLGIFLENRKGPDDFSFIAFDIRERICGRKSA